MVPLSKFDSMNSSQLETNSKFTFQISALMKCQNSVRVSMQQLNSSKEFLTGMLTFAFATSLNFGLSPDKFD